MQTIARLLDTIAYNAPQKLPAAVSIDEFKGNASTGKYQCILVDPLKHRILDILPDRTQSHLASYWRNIPRKERLKVQFLSVICGDPMQIWLERFPECKNHHRQISFYPSSYMGD